MRISVHITALVTVAVAMLQSAAFAAKVADKNPDYILIQAGEVLAVPGQASQKKKTIVIHDGRITQIRSGFIDAEGLNLGDEETAEIIDLQQYFILPGLMDAHVHLMWSSSDRPPKKQDQLNSEDLTLWTLRSARTMVSAGFTTVRDMASEPKVMFAVRDWINGGKFFGPRILAAGIPVGALGGHGDTSAVGNDPADMASWGLCAGAESCRKAVRLQHKLGSDVIKMMSTGGYFDQTGTEQLFFFDEMEATVAAAHQLDMMVATHAYAGDAIADAVRAGVDSVEHGFGVTDKTLKAMKKQKIYLVPTLTIAQRKETEVRKYREQHRGFERALETGTPIAFGTDVGGIPHRFAAREFKYMVNLGMSPAEAIKSATINTAKLFKLDGDLGTLEAGKLADIIAVKESPLRNIEALETVDFVMKSGRVLKRDGMLVDFFLD